MKRLSRFSTNLGGLFASAAVRHWMGTLEYKCAYYDESIDPVKPTYSGQKIYIFWHEYILFPLYLRGHCNLTMLLSQHRDADILTRTAYHMGFEFVRGSSYRGGVTALRELVRRSGRMNLTITPDGPRGPRRGLARGRSIWPRNSACRSWRWASATIGPGDSTPGITTPFRAHSAARGPSSARRFRFPTIWIATDSNTTGCKSSGCSIA